MQIDLNHLSFQTPSGFLDRTNYTFKDESDEELLQVNFAEPSREGMTIDEVMADRREELIEIFGDKLKIEEERPMVVAGHQARLLIFRGEGEGEGFRERWVIVQHSSEFFGLIAYRTPPEQTQYAANFKHILESVSFREEIVQQNSPDDRYVRRQAPPITLDVPRHLPPPDTYQFVSPDENVKLDLAIYDPQDSSTAQLQLEKEIEADTQSGGEITLSESVSVSVNNAHGRIITYVLLKTDLLGLRKYAVRRGQLAFDNGTTVSLEGRAPESSAAELATAFSVLLNHINRVN